MTIPEGQNWPRVKTLAYGLVFVYRIPRAMFYRSMASNAYNILEHVPFYDPRHIFFHKIERKGPFQTR